MSLEWFILTWSERTHDEQSRAGFCKICGLFALQSNHSSKTSILILKLKYSWLVLRPNWYTVKTLCSLFGYIETDCHVHKVFSRGGVPNNIVNFI